MHLDTVRLLLDLGRRQDLRARAYLSLIVRNYSISLRVLLLLYYVLKYTMTGIGCNRHVSILLELRIVALRLLRDTIPEESSREGLVVILHREHFVEAAQVIELVDSTLIDFSRELLASHLVPEQCRLFVHLLQLTVSNYPIEVLLSVGFVDAEDLKSVLNDSFFHSQV